MNEGYSDSPLVEPLEANSSPTILSRLAKSFRQLGVVAVVLAAVIYMLQGVDSVSVEFREWAWLFLMMVMGAGGFICRFLLQDVRAARVFFVLATALVPVQFSQLGGMILDIIHPVSGGEASFSLFSLGINAVSALVLALAFTYTCFSILVRHQAKLLSAAFLLFNILMLIPDRSSWVACAVLLSIMASVALIAKRLFSQHASFNTREGMVLRVLMLAPIVVMLVRNGFHVDSIFNFAGLGFISASFVIYCVPFVFDSKRLRELCLWIGGVLSVVVWSVVGISGEVFGDSTFGTFNALSYGLPLVALTFELGRLSPFNRSVYHKLACIMLVLISLVACLDEGSVISNSVIAIVGACSVVLGVVGRYKSFIYTGAFALVLSLCSLIFLSVSHVSLNIWLVLAVGGCLLVLLSSVIEKHGRSLMHYAAQINDYE